MAGKMTLREYSTAFILLGFTFSAIIAFSGSVFTEYGSNLQGEENDIQELNQNIKSAAPDTGTGGEKANSISTEDSGSFFLGSVLTVIETVTSGVGSLPNLMSVFVGDLGVSPVIVTLASIPVGWVVWEVVSLYRGLRT